MNSKWWFVWALLVVQACGASSSDVPPLAGGVPPYQKLRGVRLGMTAEELSRVRPHAKPEAYWGYSERVDGLDVGYRIPGSHSEEQTVPRGETLREVNAGKSFGSDSAAIAYWVHTVASASVLLGAPVCSRSQTGLGFRGWHARWRGDGSETSISIFARQDPAGPRKESFVATVVVSVVRRNPADRMMDWLTHFGSKPVRGSFDSLSKCAPFITD